MIKGCKGIFPWSTYKSFSIYKNLAQSDLYIYILSSTHILHGQYKSNPDLSISIINKVKTYKLLVSIKKYKKKNSNPKALVYFEKIKRKIKRLPL